MSAADPNAAAFEALEVQGAAAWWDIGHNPTARAALQWASQQHDEWAERAAQLLVSPHLKLTQDADVRLFLQGLLPAASEEFQLAILARFPLVLDQSPNARYALWYWQRSCISAIQLDGWPIAKALALRHWPDLRF